MCTVLRRPGLAGVDGEGWAEGSGRRAEPKVWLWNFIGNVFVSESIIPCLFCTSNSLHQKETEPHVFVFFLLFLKTDVRGKAVIEWLLYKHTGFVQLTASVFLLYQELVPSLVTAFFLVKGSCDLFSLRNSSRICSRPLLFSMATKLACGVLFSVCFDLPFCFPSLLFSGDLYLAAKVIVQCSGIWRLSCLTDFAPFIVPIHLLFMGLQ